MLCYSCPSPIIEMFSILLSEAKIQIETQTKMKKEKRNIKENRNRNENEIKSDWCRA